MDADLRAAAAKVYARCETQGECRVWQGAVQSAGYGHLRVGGGTMLCHRVTYAAAGNDIPAGLVLDHTCRTRRCVRVDHLEVVTVGENTGRGLWSGYWQRYRDERARQEAALDAMAIGYATERADLLERGTVKLITLTDFLRDMRGEMA